MTPALNPKAQSRGAITLSSFVDRHLRWLMPAPAIIVLALLTIAPLVFNLFLSTQDRSVSSALPIRDVGLGNYVEILRDERFCDVANAQVHADRRSGAARAWIGDCAAA